jgi:hypothetical protein
MCTYLLLLIGLGNMNRELLGFEAAVHPSPKQQLPVSEPDKQQRGNWCIVFTAQGGALNIAVHHRRRWLFFPSIDCELNRVLDDTLQLLDQSLTKHTSILPEQSLDSPWVALFQLLETAVIRQLAKKFAALSA